MHSHVWKIVEEQVQTPTENSTLLYSGITWAEAEEEISFGFAAVPFDRVKRVCVLLSLESCVWEIGKKLISSRQRKRGYDVTPQCWCI